MPRLLRRSGEISRCTRMEGRCSCRTLSFEGRGGGCGSRKGNELNCFGVVPVVEQTAGRAEFDAAVR
eukprot:10892676-Heterocapsa_arctica.AAC.1